MKIEVTGTIKKIIFEDENICLFIIEDKDYKSILLSLNKNYIDIKEQISIGQTHEFFCEIYIHKNKKNDGNVYLKNVICVKQIV